MLICMTRTGFIHLFHFHRPSVEQCNYSIVLFGHIVFTQNRTNERTNERNHEINEDEDTHPFACRNMNLLLLILLLLIHFRAAKK